MASWSTELRRREVELAAIRVVEILDSFRGVNRRLVEELLECFAVLGAEGFCQLFDDPSRRPAANAANAAAPAEQVAQPADKPRDPHAGWRWDERGHRISPKGNSAFDCCRQPTQRPPGSTFWSD
jgi:hypothetical protein